MSSTAASCVPLGGSTCTEQMMCAHTAMHRSTRQPLTSSPDCMLSMDCSPPLASARHVLLMHAKETHSFIVLGESFYCAVIDMCHKSGLAAAADMRVSTGQAHQAACHAAHASGCTRVLHTPPIESFVAARVVALKVFGPCSQAVR